MRITTSIRDIRSVIAAKKGGIDINADVSVEITYKIDKLKKENDKLRAELEKLTVSHLREVFDDNLLSFLTYCTNSRIFQRN